MIRPVNDKVLVRPDPENKMSSGGILLPETAQGGDTKTRIGTVLAVGNGKENENGVVIPMEVSPGDRVVFHRHSGTTIKENGEDLLLLEEKNIISALEVVNG